MDLLSRRAARTLVALAFILPVALPTAASAAPSNRSDSGRALGVMSAHGLHWGTTGDELNRPGPGTSQDAGKNGGKKTTGSGKTSSGLGSGPLTWYGGFVMHSFKTYAIYWIPPGYSVSSGYRTLIDGYLANVAADSGKSSNVYFADTQYSDGSGPAQYSSTFGGSVVDTNPFPPNGCSDSSLPSSPCISDAQAVAEVAAVAKAQGWTLDNKTTVAMLFPKGVGTCNNSGCAYAQACAWHHDTGGTLWMNLPYANASIGTSRPCSSGQSPNNDDADATINTLSHELNESITDPAGASWHDSVGYENGDKCSWLFGTALGGTSGQLYNQVINGAKYYTQQEWSNASSGCVLTGT